MKMSRKVSFRVAPVVKEALDLVADVEGLTVADLIRSFVNYGLTADRAQLSKFFRVGDSYRRFMGALGGPLGSRVG